MHIVVYLSNSAINNLFLFSLVMIRVWLRKLYKKNFFNVKKVGQWPPGLFKSLHCLSIGSQYNIEPHNWATTFFIRGLKVPSSGISVYQASFDHVKVNVMPLLSLKRSYLLCLTC